MLYTYQGIQFNSILTGDKQLIFRDKSLMQSLDTECPKKLTQRLVRCGGRQPDHCSRRNACPETHGLDAVKRRSLRTNGYHNLF